MKKSNIYYTAIKILIVYFPRFHFYSSYIESQRECSLIYISLKTTFLDLTLWSQASNMLQIYFDVLLTINISSSRCIGISLQSITPHTQVNYIWKMVLPVNNFEMWWSWKVENILLGEHYSLYYFVHLKWICHRGKEMFNINREIFVQLLLY